MAQQSQAIHQLLDAEKKAGEIVEAARKRKNGNTAVIDFIAATTWCVESPLLSLKAEA